ncbi:hypothetical protein [Krasilnikoviella flava]|nr:hypothetical protein [Krasilnikoviella flava]
MAELDLPGRAPSVVGHGVHEVRVGAQAPASPAVEARTTSVG